MNSYYFADLHINMDCQLDIVCQRSEKFLIQEHTPEITLKIPEKLTQDWIKKYTHLTPAEIELILMESQFAYNLLFHSGFVLHSSAIGFQNRAVLFSADSGVGKSTHTRLWQKRFGREQVPILNDDKPAIRLMEDTFYVYGTPFSGNSEENANLRLPLHAIVFLNRDQQNSIRRLSSEEAIPLILRQTLRPKNSMEHMDALLSFLDRLLPVIPVYQLNCNMEEDAVTTVLNALFPHWNEK